jgi:hypothetical protein
MRLQSESKRKKVKRKYRVVKSGEKEDICGGRKVCSERLEKGDKQKKGEQRVERKEGRVERGEEHEGKGKRLKGI